MCENKRSGKGNSYVHQDIMAFLLVMNETNPNMKELVFRNKIDKTRIGPNAKLANTSITKNYNFDITVKYRGTNDLHTVIEIEEDYLRTNTRLKLEDCVSKISTLNAIVILIKNKTGEIAYQKIVANTDGTFERVKIDELFGIKTSVITEQFVEYLKYTGKIYDYEVTWKTT